MPDAPEIGRKKLAWVHVPSQPTCGLLPHGFKASSCISELTTGVSSVSNKGVGMLDYIWAGADGSTVLEVVAVLVPALVLLWIVMTVMALHKRDVYFWSLGSTWTSVIACPIALVIMCFSSFSQLNDPNVPLFHAPIAAGAILYVVALAFAIFYNYNATRSAMLAFSTSMLQQLAVLGVIFLFFRWQGDEVNRGR